MKHFRQSCYDDDSLGPDPYALQEAWKRKVTYECEKPGCDNVVDYEHVEYRTKYDPGTGEYRLIQLCRSCASAWDTWRDW